MIRWFVDLVYPICPVCDGSGGSEGYYGGDWTGCFCCNPNEDREEPVVRIWRWHLWRYRYGLWSLDRWIAKQQEGERKNPSLYIDGVNQREDILTTQVEDCPVCSTYLETSFGLGGGGFGFYGYCPKCERIIWKCQVEE